MKPGHEVTKSNLNILRWLIATSKGMRLQAALNATLGVVGVALDFAFIYATKWTIDIATDPTQSVSLTPAALCLVGIMVSQILLGYARRWMGQVLNVRAQNIMQRHIFARVLHNEWNGTESRHTGDMLNRLERDVRDITTTITDTLPSTITVAVRFIGAFWFLFSMAPRLALLLAIIAPIFILFSRIYIRRMRAITRQVRNTDSSIQSLMQEGLQHNLVLKTLEHEEETLAQLHTSQNALQHQIKQRTRFSATSSMLINIGFSTGYITTFLWGVYNLQQGTITYGMMIAFIQLVGQIQGPFRDMMRFVPLMTGAFTAGERLMELEDEPMEMKGEPVRFAQGAGIELTDVCYAYKGGHRQILSHFSYTFPAGSRTAILGETGAGKTTLIRLILALVHPQSGSIRIYDAQQSVPISPLTRCNLVYVPQGNTLFSGTVRSNLLMGNPQATEQQMKEALHVACADFILALPYGLDTRCGENGTGLSEGQMQRISIARALLRRGNILLLDEASSALDNDTEQQLLCNLNQWLKPHQTLIFITHRRSVTQLCPRTLHIRRNND